MSNRIVDLDNDFFDIEDEYTSDAKKLNKISGETKENSDEIEKLKKQVNEMIDIYNIPVDKLEENAITIDWDELNKSISIDFDAIRDNADRKSKQDEKRFPPMSKQEYVICFVTGFVASLIDIFLVGAPKRIKLCGGKEVIDGSVLTELLRKLGQDENGIIHRFYEFLEDVCKVPYDIVDMQKGIMPKNHRLKSLAHDPLYGLIFAIFDLVCGTATMVNNGIIKIYMRGNQSIQKKILSVLYYMGHLISDIFTSMGLPMPGGFLTQILELKIGDINIAETFEKMYINGYDLRHFVSMTSSVAFQKLVINLYFKYNKTEKKDNVIRAIRETEDIQEKAKRQKMLFIVSSIATTGNAVKFLISRCRPESINIPQILDSIQEAIKFTEAATRDMTYERIAINRKTIDETWQELLEI